FIERLFPEIFETRWGNRADYYSLFVAVASLIGTHKLPPKNVPRLRTKLQRFANEVDKRLEKPTTNTSDGARIYARAIEKGSNDKARRADRHDVLVFVVRPFLLVSK